MQCPFCGNAETKVTNSRQSAKGDSIRRRRECLACQERFTTFEMVEQIPIIVVKRDGSREPFERPKILAGVQRACMKRPISAAQMEQIITAVEQNVFTTMDKEVPSSYIGELVLRQLRSIDQVAYIRFASVYRSFNNVQEFYDEVNSLIERDKKENSGK
ncbi:transcriptional repressor NrdR [Candidatus Sumerlaeota bacterium]|nr:transcriptional regulator NrdR [Candidatus Sumerlaeales bacterium]NLD61367.1 transcriptional repressor NrdR [Candidatus Sumerlaeota bacterium]